MCLLNTYKDFSKLKSCQILPIIKTYMILLLKYVKISDVPDPNAGSGIIRPLLAEIWIQSDLDLKKRSRSGSGRISNWKQDIIRFQSALNLKINPGSGSVYF